jgi:signal transduction histidine kinase
VRSRLIALILVPTLAAVILGGVQVVSSVHAASDFKRVNHLAQLVADVSGLTHELAAERDLTAMYIARGRPDRDRTAVETQMSRVDGAAQNVRASAGVLLDEVTGRTRDIVETVLSRLGDLPALRDQALGKRLLPDAAIGLYSRVTGDLLSLYDELGKGGNDDDLSGRSQLLESLAKAKESLSRQRGILAVVLTTGRFEQDEMQDFLGALSDERNERQAFGAAASSEERRFFDETVNGSTASRADFLRTLVLIRADSGAPLQGLDLTKPNDAQEWFNAVTITIDRMRIVEKRHVSAILGRSAQLEDDERRQAFVGGGLVGALLLVVLLVTTGVARSLVRPLRRLRSEALEIAGHRLPETVQRLRDAGAEAAIPEVQPIGVSSRDEIGEVARAFDEVHREAVRLAGDEARLRSNVNAIFVNLSRRSQTLVERQLSLIERLEQGEENERRLADLFTLDHLATRMRRNSENLLVLAGQEAARRRSEPVELLDVVRAAVSEVENYERAVMRVQSDIALAGQAVSDIVHLLAELVENALWFSPAETKVFVSSNRIDGSGVMISVTDQGIGMTAEELAQVNWRLAEPPVVDVAASRRMGLFVVGRLALRHGIRVQLRSQEAGGLTAMVLVPETLVVNLGAQLFTGTGGMPTMTPPQPGPLTGPPGGPLSGPLSGPHPGLQPGSHPGSPQGPAIAPGGQHQVTSGGLPRRGTGGGEPFTMDRLRPFPPPAEPPALNAPWPEAHTAWPDAPRGEARPPFQPMVPPPVSEADMTGPIPAVSWGDGAGLGPDSGVSGADTTAGGDEYLPIFAEVESHWFKRTGSHPATAAPRSDDPPTGRRGDPPTGPQPAPQSGWTSPADAGWRAARSLSEPTHGGTTRGGLPKRVPKANLVPGTVDTGGKAARPQPIPPMSAERMRSRLASYQAGLRQGRAHARRDPVNGAAGDASTGGNDDA